MGFGVLIAGYYTTYLLGMLMKSEWYGAAIILCGYLVMASGLLRLSEYEDRFRHALFFEAFLSCHALYYLLSLLDGAFLWGLPIFTGIYTEVAGYLEIILFVVFHIFLLLAIRRLAADVELPKLVFSSTRNLVLLGLYTALAAFLRLPLSFVKNYGGYFSGAAALMQILFYVLMAVLLLGCYMRISDEADVDMPMKKSRFAWINRMQEIRDENEKRAVDSTRAYAEEKLKKRRENREEHLRMRQEHQRKRQRKKKK